MSKEQLKQHLTENGKDRSYSELAQMFNITNGAGYPSDEAVRSIWRNLKKKLESEEEESIDTQGMTIKRVWKRAEGGYSVEYANNDNSFDPKEFREKLIEEISKFSPKQHKIDYPKGKEKNLLEISLPDIHYGKEETKKTEESFIESVKDILKKAQGYDIEKIVLPIGNDGMNSEGRTRATTKGTPQFDSADWFESFRGYWQMLVEAIDIIKQVAPVDVISVLGNHDCHDEETEALTKEGWKRYFELSKNDKIATINKYTKEVEYQHPEEVIQYNYEGEMYSIKNNYTDLLVTPNHRMLYRRPHHDEYSYCTAEELHNIGEAIYFRSNGSNFNDEYPIKDDYLRLFAWINSDGSVGHRDYGNNYTIYQNERKVNKVLEVLDNLGIGYSVYNRNRNIDSIGGVKLKRFNHTEYCIMLNLKQSNQEVIDFLTKHLPDKYIIPDVLEKCSERQVDVYLSTYIDGDGTRKKNRKNDNWASIYGTRGILEQIQRLAIENGYTSTMSKYRNTQHRLSVIKDKNSTRIKKNNKSKEHYSGKVWCLSLPNKNFFVRRNGKVSVQGNCERMQYISDVIYAWYKNDPNVTVNNEMEYRKYYQYGKCMIMYTHGDDEGPKDLVMNMPMEQPKMFSETKHQEVHLGHIHKETVLDEFKKIKVRFLPSLCSTDEWHKKKGYEQYKAAQGFVWNKERGLEGFVQSNAE